MAMIANGKVLIEGRPQETIAQLRSRVWRRSVSEADLGAYQSRLQVLSMRRAAGTPHINVFSEAQPEAGFVMVEPDLEDVYFLRRAPPGPPPPSPKDTIYMERILTCRNRLDADV